MLYLTYAEPPSGVYSSQAIDVIKYLNSIGGSIRLVAFISLHQFRLNRKKILREMPGAIVIPMVPKATYWQLNVWSLFLICLLTGKRAIIARNVIATNMALRLKKTRLIKKVCFDGRGAIAAEWKEYDVKVVDQWKKNIDEWEKKAVLESDFRIAVTEQLVYYWQLRYGYNSSKHVIIPCTVNSSFILQNANEESISNNKKSLGINDNDIVFAYSGSTAGWQSFKTLESFIEPLLKANNHYKIIFLAQQENSINQLMQKFSGQVLRKWVAHKDVVNILSVCDYGILIREETVTNKVASPTKFAEYLSSGLPVIISDNLGDYSYFVDEHNCGIRLNGKVHAFSKPRKEEKERMKQLVLHFFTKEANCNKYLELLQELN